MRFMLLAAKYAILRFAVTAYAVDYIRWALQEVRAAVDGPRQLPCV